MKKEKFPGFEKCMAMMRQRRDQLLQDDGFLWLEPRAGEFVEELMEEFKNEERIGIRGWLLELIGSAKSPLAFELLASELRSPDPVHRRWAIRGLKNLNTKEARTCLWEARSFTFGTPEETEEFRKVLTEYLGK